MVIPWLTLVVPQLTLVVPWPTLVVPQLTLVVHLTQCQFLRQPLLWRHFLFTSPVASHVTIGHNSLWIWDNMYIQKSVCSANYDMTDKEEWTLSFSLVLSPCHYCQLPFYYSLRPCFVVGIMIRGNSSKGNVRKYEPVAQACGARQAIRNLNLVAPACGAGQVIRTLMWTCRSSLWGWTGRAKP
jgi:hypothetical protein